MEQDPGEALMISHLKLYKKIASKTRMNSGVEQIRKHYIELTITLDELCSRGYNVSQTDHIYMYKMAGELNRKIILKLESLRK